MGRQVTIYALCEPETNEVRYIGATSTSLAARYTSHLTATRLGLEANAVKREWIATILAQGKKPSCIVLELCGRLSARDRERWWVEQYASERLTNRNWNPTRSIKWQPTQ